MRSRRGRRDPAIRLPREANGCRDPGDDRARLGAHRRPLDQGDHRLAAPGGRRRDRSPPAHADRALRAGPAAQAQRRPGRPRNDGQAASPERRQRCSTAARPLPSRETTTRRTCRRRPTLWCAAQLEQERRLVNDLTNSGAAYLAHKSVFDVPLTANEIPDHSDALRPDPHPRRPHLERLSERGPHDRGAGRCQRELADQDPDRARLPRPLDLGPPGACPGRGDPPPDRPLPQPR